MEHKKFFAELLRVIPKQEGVKFENEGEKINVKMDDGREFIIRKSGGITFEGKIEFDEKLENLHDCIVNTVRDVKEYLQAMDTSPALIAQDLDMPYKKLAEFNSIVLGGVGRGNGMGYESTTWEYINNKQGLYQGHYYSDYDKAKEDFAVRSGLVEENKIFNNQELCEIYRCVSDTLDGYYELTDGQHQMLEDSQDRILGSSKCGHMRKWQESGRCNSKISQFR